MKTTPHWKVKLRLWIHRLDRRLNESPINGAPTVSVPCPIEGCTKEASFWLGALPESDKRDMRVFMARYFDAANDALFHHMMSDHGGHDDDCPRRLDENDYCSCVYPAVS
ncbi:hypothetical protein A5742_25635 [Mycolicibacterium fortuitum]|uniref:Uncharacterized protein n=1 Tax=Mycolicibacterium fortuitum TaxID=1766 RepID=A0ABD6QNM2_MYCFO|nr:hypothetical protein [Mycolicibacterium fortuitum]OMC46161.1 hypothetical protein A5742_25635 [Mycolicibacterium fortuitum]